MGNFVIDEKHPEAAIELRLIDDSLNLIFHFPHSMTVSEKNGVQARALKVVEENWLNADIEDVPSIDSISFQDGARDEVVQIEFGRGGISTLEIAREIAKKAAS